ncbi:DUF1775 domain-containing protein [Streptomyces californicus]|uniref:DUF1775 domain-containing protein n=1 Tax=Streptomyces californicus TaxID=67351 RepID=UPI0036FA15D8
MFAFSHAANRGVKVALVAAAVVLAAAGPAAAHVEVEASDAQALAENVTLDFLAEAESDTAGITELRIVLPEGIAPADVTYKSGPKGWKLAPTADGYTVKGPAVEPGTDAEYSVVVRQLPDAKNLAFKTLQTYSDKRVDRWINLDSEGEGPAPILDLKPAAPGAAPATSAATTSPSATPTPTASSPQPHGTAHAQMSDDRASEDSGSSTGLWWGIGGALLLAAVVAVVLGMRRRNSA